MNSQTPRTESGRRLLTHAEGWQRRAWMEYILAIEAEAAGPDSEMVTPSAIGDWQYGAPDPWKLRSEGAAPRAEGLDVDALSDALEASPTFRQVRHGRVLSPKVDADAVAREILGRLAPQERRDND